MSEKINCNETIHSLIEEQVKRTPGAIALCSDEGSLDYESLLERSTYLAKKLISMGVRPGDRVGICLSRDLHIHVVLLGVLKAGASYVPLDPTFPIERLEYMVTKSGMNVLVHNDGTHFIEFKNSCHKLNVSSIHWNDINSCASFDDIELPSVSSDASCYLMFTSGSTGNPKGVDITHHTVVNCLSWVKKTFQLSSDDVFLSQTTFSFDISVTELFAPLIAGARCALVSDEQKYSPSELIEFIRKFKVTHIQFVPTALRTMSLLGGLEACTSLKYIISCGEALPQDLVNQLLGTIPVEIHNLYGPTEATIYATHWRCQPHLPFTISPIGTPLDYVRAYVLDDAHEPVPAGEMGELYLGGECLAKGYFGDREKTEKSFIQQLPQNIAETRIYKTGDCVKWNPYGFYEYLGRLDRQVKIRGYRVEPGEVETILRQFDGIEHAFVLVNQDNTGNNYLEAFCVTGAKFNLSNQYIKDVLIKQFPFYMVPNKIYFNSELPTLPNGKVNYSALSALREESI